MQLNNKKTNNPTKKRASTGDSTQYSVMTYMGKESKKSGSMYMYN